MTEVNCVVKGLAFKDVTAVLEIQGKPSEEDENCTKVEINFFHKPVKIPLMEQRRNPDDGASRMEFIRYEQLRESPTDILHHPHCLTQSEQLFRSSRTTQRRSYA